MKKPVWIGATVLVPLAIMFVGISGTESPAQFEARAPRVIIIALIVSALMTVAYPLASKRKNGVALATNDQAQEPDSRRGTQSYVFAFISVVVALAVLLAAQMALLRFHVAVGFVTFSSIILQQAAFAIASLIIGTRSQSSRRSPHPAMALLGIAGFAFFFGLGTPTILRALAYNLQSAPFDYSNAIFAVPAVVIAAICWIRVCLAHGFRSP